MIKELMELEYNCSALFLVPPLGITIGELVSVGFINSYLKIDEDISQGCENPVFMLFKKPANDGGKFADFLVTQMNKNRNFIEEIDCENHTILIYCIPEEFNGDYELLIIGKYSKFSKKFKGKHDKYVKGKKEHKEYTMQYRVMYKDPSWKAEVEEFFNTKLDSGDELWKLPDMNKETLKMSSICITQ